MRGMPEIMFVGSFCSFLWCFGPLGRGVEAALWGLRGPGSALLRRVEALFCLLRLRGSAKV